MFRIEGGDYYTAAEVAEMFGVSKRYIMRLASKGTLLAEGTPLGYLFPAELTEAKWEELKHHRRGEDDNR